MDLVKLMSRTDRKALVVKHLKEYNLELREDSRLCNNFILHGSLPRKYNSLDKVAERMAEKKYLYEYTNGEYQKVLDEMYKYWGEVRNSGRDPITTPDIMAEVIVMKGKFFPDEWPWMVDPVDYYYDKKM